MNQPIFVKGTPADNGDILDFGNYVFSHDGNPTDFIRMVPKCYRQGNEVPDQHYLVKENDRIRAMIGSFPLTMQPKSRKKALSARSICWGSWV